MDRFILLLDPYEYLITPFGDHEILNFTLLSKIVPATFFSVWSPFPACRLQL